MDLMASDSRVLEEPAPGVMLSELADSSVNLNLRLWVVATEYWDVLFDLTRRGKETFDEQGIEIPYPQTVVHRAERAE